MIEVWKISYGSANFDSEMGYMVLIMEHRISSSKWSTASQITARNSSTEGELQKSGVKTPWNELKSGFNLNSLSYWQILIPTNNDPLLFAKNALANNHTSRVRRRFESLDTLQYVVNEWSRAIQCCGNKNMKINYRLQKYAIRQTV